MNDPMKKLVICATQRSGSTMLCKELESTSVLGRPKEAYINPIIDDSKSAQEFIDRIWQQGSSENGVFAVKIMQTQWGKVDYVHSFSQSSPSLLEATLNELKFKNAKDPLLSSQVKNFYNFYKTSVWVFLRRRDHLYQAISREMANQTKVCHILNTDDSEKIAGIGKRTSISTQDSNNYNQKAIYNAPNIQRRINEIKNEEIAWLYFFDSYQIKPIELFYEDIVDNKDYLKKLASKLDVNIPKELPPIPLVKVGNEINEEWAKRFRSEQPLRG